jgi:hypothetical protein
MLSHRPQVFAQYAAVDACNSEMTPEGAVGNPKAITDIGYKPKF